MQTLLELIKVSQFGGEVSPSSDFSGIVDEARKQSVLGLVAPVLPKECLTGEDAHTVERQYANYVRYLHEEDELKKVLDRVGIPFVILKGNAAAVYYKDPSLRTMGDIDFLVRPDDFTRARAVMLENGFSLEHEGEEYTRHIAFSKNKVSFELHKKFSHEDVDLEEYMLAGLEARELRSIQGYEFPMLPKLSNGLVLLDHMRNHLRSGLGLRQIVDWMMFVHAELDDGFWAEFGPVTASKKLDTLALVVTRMCQMYMGLDESITWCRGADEETCRMLMENVLTSGNFGRKQGKGNRIEAVTTAFRSEGFFRRLQRAGEYNWKAYKKHRWLKPSCWIYQMFRYARQGLQTKRSSAQMREDAKRGKERYELLKRLGIE